MSHIRFVPALESFEERLNLSTFAHTAAFSTSKPPPTPAVVEYLVLATVHHGVQFTGGVRVAVADVGGDN